VVALDSANELDRLEPGTSVKHHDAGLERYDDVHLAIWVQFRHDATARI
jgi:hypothetical protein